MNIALLSFFSIKEPYRIFSESARRLLSLTSSNVTSYVNETTPLNATIEISATSPTSSPTITATILSTTTSFTPTQETTLATKIVYEEVEDPNWVNPVIIGGGISAIIAFVIIAFIVRWQLLKFLDKHAQKKDRNFASSKDDEENKDAGKEGEQTMRDSARKKAEKLKAQKDRARKFRESKLKAISERSVSSVRQRGLSRHSFRFGSSVNLLEGMSLGRSRAISDLNEQSSREPSVSEKQKHQKLTLDQHPNQVLLDLERQLGNLEGARISVMDSVDYTGHCVGEFDDEIQNLNTMRTNNLNTILGMLERFQVRGIEGMQQADPTLHDVHSVIVE